MGRAARPLGPRPWGGLVERPDLASPEVRELRRQVALACRILYKLGLADYLGHPSARIGDGDHVVVKAGKSVRVRGMAEMGVDQMLVVDLDGRQHLGDDLPLGTPRIIPPAEIAELREDVAAPAGRWAYYSSLVEEPH